MTASLLACFPASAADSSKWYPWLDADGSATTAGRGIGELDAFLPIWQDGTTLVFANAKFKGDTDKTLEGNFGFGARHMLDAGWNIGAYGFFDRRFTARGNSFNQLTFGAEVLSDTFDVRVNGYVPIGISSVPVAGVDVARLHGASVIVISNAEVTLGGFDTEIGYHLPIFEEDSPFDLKAYAGGFYFSGPQGATIAGPRFRAEFTSAFDNGMRLSVGGGWQTDSLRGGQGFANLRFRVPLSGGKSGSTLSPQERRMLDPIVRDVDIVTAAGAYGTSEVANQLSDGTKLVVIDSANAYGSDLTDELVTAGANALVILSGTFNTTAKSQLQSGQTLMGKGVVEVKTASGKTATLTTQSATIAGSVNGATGDAMVMMANNSTVRGLSVSNTVNENHVAVAIRATEVTGVTIADNTLKSNADQNLSAALYLDTASNVTVTGNRLDASANLSSTAMRVSDTNQLAVSNNTLNSTAPGVSYTVEVEDTTNLSGTGNTALSGSCDDRGGNTGTISFTNAANCP